MVSSNDIESILSSLDGIKRAQAPSFLYGKIITRIKFPEQNIFDKFGHLLLRPATVISFLFIFLFIDGIAFQSFLKSKSGNMENFSEEISLNDYFDEIFYYDLSESEYTFID